MGTISQKLTYLNDTKQLLKENINNLGGNLTNEPFRQYASVLEGIYESLPKVSGIGASLSLSPSMVGKIKLNEIQGNTLQNGTPTPSSPVPIQSVTGLQNIEVCGKNLCFNITKPSNANLRFFINKSISKTFTISFTTNEALNGNSLYLEVDGTGYGNIGGITASANTKVEKTYTLSDTNYQAIENGTNIDLLLYKNGANFNIPDDGMIEKGSSATEYEPYKGNTYEVNLGNIELNKKGDYKDIIKKSTGKNLFDKNNVSIISGVYINNSTGEIVSGGTSSVINNILVISNTTYTLTAVGKNKIAFYDSNNNYLSNITSNLTTFTTPANCKYIKIQLATETLNVNTIRLELGTQQTTYEPYGKVWYVEKQIGKVVLDGSEDYSIRNQGDGSTTITFNLLNFVIPSSSNKYCNYFSYSQSSQDGAEGYGISNNTIYFEIKRERLSSLDAISFKTWLSTHNTTIYYVLATPEYTEITNTELIEQLEALNNAKSEDGTTNINVTSEDLSMILNVGVLKGE